MVTRKDEVVVQLLAEVNVSLHDHRSSKSTSGQRNDLCNYAFVRLRAVILRDALQAHLVGLQQDFALRAIHICEEDGTQR